MVRLKIWNYKVTWKIRKVIEEEREETLERLFFSTKSFTFSYTKSYLTIWRWRFILSDICEWCKKIKEIVSLLTVKYRRNVSFCICNSKYQWFCVCVCVDVCVA